MNIRPLRASSMISSIGDMTSIKLMSLSRSCGDYISGAFGAVTY
jgi:hypothetical protein